MKETVTKMRLLSLPYRLRICCQITCIGKPVIHACKYWLFIPKNIQIKPHLGNWVEGTSSFLGNIAESVW